MKTAKLKNILTGEIVAVHATTDSPDSSYGILCWVDDDGVSYGQVPYGPPMGFELFDVIEDEAHIEDEAEPSPYSLVYDHPLLRHLVPSGKTPHLDTLAEQGLLDVLTTEQAAKVVIIAQTAYRNGQRGAGAERIDNDAVWIDGVGGIEKQPDGLWKLTMPDGGIDTSMAAARLGSQGGKSTSATKAAAARENGKRGGRPRKQTPVS